MMVSTLRKAAPQPSISWGAAPNPEPTTPPAAYTTGQALHRAAQPGYHHWLEHIRAAAGCTRPIRLSGDLTTLEAGTGRVLHQRHTNDLPDSVIYKACGNRRARVCPTCAQTYQRDAYQLLRAGLIGGKGIPETVSTHPAVFVTLTAPSFGPVHTHTINKHTCTNRKKCDCQPQPCHPRRTNHLCEHGQPAVCWTRHQPDDPALGQPLCLDCYHHNHHVNWNSFAGELWRRTKQTAQRYLAQLAQQRGIPPIQIITASGTIRRIPPLRLSHGKAAEFQTRGAVHFHALIRLDGINPHDSAAIIPPPAGLTTQDLEEAIRYAATHTAFTTPPHPDQPDGWPIHWGQQLDIRPITLTGHGELTDTMVAGYLAKYATKSTETTGHTSTRLNTESIKDYADPDGHHTARLINACWHLGRPTHTTPCQTQLDTRPTKPANPNPYHRLRRWAHMLGFGGHFLTKARHYSTTFQLLREHRISFRRNEITTGPQQPNTTNQTSEETTLIINNLTYTGTGWHTTGDALLANTAAAQARERQAIGREELAHETATTIPNPMIAAA